MSSWNTGRRHARKGIEGFHSLGNWFQELWEKNLSLTFRRLKMRQMSLLETLGNKYPMTECHTPEQKPPQLHHHCENPITHKFQAPKYSTFSCGSMQSYTLPLLQARAATQSTYNVMLPQIRIMFTPPQVSNQPDTISLRGTAMALRQFTVTGKTMKGIEFLT